MSGGYFARTDLPWAGRQGRGIRQLANICDVLDFDLTRRVARAVEWAVLERLCVGNGTESSNLSPSALYQKRLYIRNGIGSSNLPLSTNLKYRPFLGGDFVWRRGAGTGVPVWEIRSPVEHIL